LIEIHEDQHNHEHAVRRISIAEADDRMMAEHQPVHPEEVGTDGDARGEEEEEGMD
jgi:hypothetical protein